MQHRVAGHNIKRRSRSRHCAGYIRTGHNIKSKKTAKAKVAFNFFRKTGSDFCDVVPDTASEPCSRLGFHSGVCCTPSNLLTVRGSSYMISRRTFSTVGRYSNRNRDSSTSPPFLPCCMGCIVVKSTVGLLSATVVDYKQ